jgi:hypothetical protein
LNGVRFGRIKTQQETDPTARHRAWKDLSNNDHERVIATRWARARRMHGVAHGEPNSCNVAHS